MFRFISTTRLHFASYNLLTTISSFHALSTPFPHTVPCENPRLALSSLFYTCLVCLHPLVTTLVMPSFAGWRLWSDAPTLLLRHCPLMTITALPPLTRSGSGVSSVREPLVPRRVAGSISLWPILLPLVGKPSVLTTERWSILTWLPRACQVGEEESGAGQEWYACLVAWFVVEVSLVLFFSIPY
jgi:hypothetical protein